MRRLLAVILFVSVLGCGTATYAKGYADKVIDQLRAQGFEAIHVEKTLLGRMRIHATDTRGEREIIVNPSTGEILRDLWLVRFGQGSGAKGAGDRATIRDDRRPDRDDEKDDDEKDDKDKNQSGGSSSDDDGRDD